MKFKRGDSLELRFWSNSALILWNKSENAFKFVIDEKSTFFEKLHLISGVLSASKHLYQLLQFQKQKTDIESNFRVKQFNSILFGMNIGNISSEMFLLEWLKSSENDIVLIGNISGLLWSASTRSEKYIFPYLT